MRRIRFSAVSYSIISKAIQVISIVVFFLLAFFFWGFCEAHVDLIDFRTPDMNNVEREAKDKSGREAAERCREGKGSERDKEKAGEWEREHMSCKWERDYTP